jgi:hypothetical protein
MGRFFFDDKNLLEVTFGDLTAIELGGEGLNFKNLLSKTSHKDIRLQRGAQEFVTTVPLWMDDSRFGVMLEAGNLEIKNCGTDGLFYAEQSADMDQSILWLKSRNSRLCAMSYLEGLFPGLDYVFEMNTIGDGQPLRLWVKNAAESLYLDTRIPNSDSLLSSYLFLPRTFTDEVGYELTLENRSFSFDEVEHGIKNISAWLVPGKYLQSLLLVKNEETRREESSYIEIDVAHPLETIYRINLPGVQVLDKARSIILAQGFDPFWIGVGRFQDGWMILPGHQRLNGWEQMWAVPDNLGTNPSSVWLIYWPQLVLFIAQATSGLLLISCIMWLRREKRTEL